MADCFDEMQVFKFKATCGDRYNKRQKGFPTEVQSTEWNHRLRRIAELFGRNKVRIQSEFKNFGGGACSVHMEVQHLYILKCYASTLKMQISFRRN